MLTCVLCVTSSLDICHLEDDDDFANTIVMLCEYNYAFIHTIFPYCSPVSSSAAEFNLFVMAPMPFGCRAAADCNIQLLQRQVRSDAMLCPNQSCRPPALHRFVKLQMILQSQILSIFTLCYRALGNL